MLCIVGIGHMGKAVLAGLARNGSQELTAVVRDESRHAQLAAEFRTVRFVTSPVPCDGAVIAVRPKDVEVAVRQAVDAGAHRILSLATGKTLSGLREIAGVPVARAMPNLGANLGMSATSVCAQDSSTLDWAAEVMSSVGTVVRIDESQIHAATGLAGSGPAYVLLFAASMIEAGVAQGLSIDVARELTIATVQGAGALLAQGDPEETVNAIAVPGGTTQEGVRVLKERDLPDVVSETVAAAARRSKEIMQEMNS
jgi:pyrroline-5-carboxylate reductase